MAIETLDLLQFHWWDYADSRYLDALAQLADLRDAGAIRHLALTNFDTERLSRILDHGIRIVSFNASSGIASTRAIRCSCTMRNSAISASRLFVMRSFTRS
jgi:aryl-alcohol dehydrogenase-like predicted oxidoreductase